MGLGLTSQAGEGKADISVGAVLMSIPVGPETVHTSFFNIANQRESFSC